MANAYVPDPSAERRAFPRIPLSWSAAIGFANEWDLLPATLEDVSGGGACVLTALNASSGDDLLVVLTGESESIAALARVVRAFSVGEDEYKLHLQFRWLQETSRAALAGLFHPRVVTNTDD